MRKRYTKMWRVLPASTYDNLHQKDNMLSTESYIYLNGQNIKWDNYMSNMTFLHFTPFLFNKYNTYSMLFCFAKPQMFPPSL